MMDELMSRLSAKPTSVDKSQTKKDGVSHNNTFETAHSSSSKSNKRTAVKESPKPVVKEEKFSSDDHSSKPDITTSNKNNTEEPKIQKELATRGGDDAGTVSAVEESKSVDCKNLGTERTDLDSSNLQQAVAIKEMEIQTDEIVSC